MPFDLDRHFTYHAPTEDVAPKYAAIRAAEFKAHILFAQLRERSAPAEGQPLTVEDCDAVNETTRALAEAIDVNAPDSADKTAAYRCVRLARNGANEWIMAHVSGYPLHVDSLVLATENLVLARWQANGAIACGGK